MTLKASNYPTIHPSLDLNFSQTKRLDPRITFSRSSTGTYFDANGVLQSAPAGVARFDHNPETGESLGLLMEAAGTNYHRYSTNFANWTFSQPTSTLTPTAETLDPSGASGAYTLYGIMQRSSEPGPGSGASFPFRGSVFVKKHPLGTNIFAFALTAAGGDSGVSVDLNTGAISSTSGSPKNIVVQAYPNGWYRVSFYITPGSSNWRPVIGSSPNATAYWYVFGVQIESATFDTSYIPTSGSAVTRAADVCTVTNSNIYDTDSFTIINQPFGASTNDGSTLTLFDGPQPIKRATVYTTDLSQTTVNAAAGKTDEFWRWRVLGSSFALPNFATDGQVTVDWGDGTIETLTTAEHTFSNGSGYHDIGFRLDSGTYFKPYINGNASHRAKVVALGPAPESIKLNAQRAFKECNNLEAFDATIDATAGTIFDGAWLSCSSLTSFPLIDTSAGTNFNSAWNACSSLTSFPAIDTSSGTNFNYTWNNCNSLTSFPLINTAAGTSFSYAWRNCSSLTSFPLIDTAAGTSFAFAWSGCNSLTSFPLINTAAGTNFSYAWNGCSSLTSFPLIDTAAGTNFTQAWNGCTSLTSFPLIDTAAGTSFYQSWYGCIGLTSFPLIDTSSGTDFFRAWRNCSSLTSFPLINTAAGTNFQQAWYNCTSLTDFPANFFDSWTGTPANNCFALAWDLCSALTATSVENILNSIDTSGQSAPASGVDITIDYNAGTGTPSVATAITNLKSRGWTITLNGVAQ